jgi:hypothetical protein
MPAVEKGSRLNGCDGREKSRSRTNMGLQALPDELLAMILAAAGQDTRLQCRLVCKALKRACDTPAAWPDMSVVLPNGARYINDYRPSHVTVSGECALEEVCTAAAASAITHLSLPAPQKLGAFPNVACVEFRDPLRGAPHMPRLSRTTGFSTPWPAVKELRVTVGKNTWWRWTRSLPDSVEHVKVSLLSGFWPLAQLPPTVKTLEIHADSSVEYFCLTFEAVRSLEHFLVVCDHALLTITFSDVPSAKEWAQWLVNTKVTLPPLTDISLYTA